MNLKKKNISKDACLEVMAERGRKTLLFGPMKPVGLEDPKQVNVHCCRSITTR